MGVTLYLIRQRLDRISPSLFRMGDADIDVVYLEQATSVLSSGTEGSMVCGEGIAANSSRSILTYDDLVEKIFSSERVLVL
jgi:hypothetical protein